MRNEIERRERKRKRKRQNEKERRERKKERKTNREREEGESKRDRGERNGIERKREPFKSSSCVCNGKSMLRHSRIT